MTWVLAGTDPAGSGCGVDVKRIWDGVGPQVKLAQTYEDKGRMRVSAFLEWGG